MTARQLAEAASAREAAMTRAMADEDGHGDADADDAEAFDAALLAWDDADEAALGALQSEDDGARAGVVPAASASAITLHSRLALNPNKAGLQAADRERVNQVIYEASKVCRTRGGGASALLPARGRHRRSARHSVQGGRSHGLQGSRFFKREQQRDELVSQRAAKLKIEFEAFKRQQHTPAAMAAARHVEALVQQLEARRDLSRTIVHVDMDGPSHAHTCATGSSHEWR